MIDKERPSVEPEDNNDSQSLATELRGMHIESTDDGQATKPAETEEMTADQYLAEAKSILNVLERQMSFEIKEGALEKLVEYAKDPNKYDKLRSMVEALRRRYGREIKRFQEHKADRKEHAFETRDRVGELLDGVLPTLERDFRESPREYIRSAIAHEQRVYDLDLDQRREATILRDGVLRGDEEQESYGNFCKNNDIDPVMFSSDLESLWLGSDHIRGIIDGKNMIAFDEVVYSISDTFITKFMNMNAVPVGEYGRGLASRLHITLASMERLLKDHEELFAEYEQRVGEDVVDKYVRARDNNPSEAATMLTVAEGVLTVQQAFILLTAQKIEGYPYTTDDQLLRDLHSNGCIERLARIIASSGKIGPLVLVGGYYPDLVKYDEQKGLQLNPDWIAEQHQMRLRDRYSAFKRPTRETQKYMSLMGCPAALSSEDGSNSVGKYTGFFLEVFDATKLAG